jgi:hypothetical protein
MHVLENEHFLETCPQLRKMVSAILFVMGKNRDDIKAEEDKALALTAQAAKEAGGETDKPQSRLLTRRVSLDMRRVKLVEGNMSKAQMTTAGTSEAELDFTLALSQHLYSICPKGGNAMTEVIDAEILDIYYDWFTRAQAIFRERAKTARMTQPTAASTSAMSSMALFAAKQASSKLPLHTSMQLGRMISLKISNDSHEHDHLGWQPIEVSDAISCLLESAYEDLNDHTREGPMLAASEYTFKYFHAVYSNSTAISRSNLAKFSHGVLAHHSGSSTGQNNLCLRINTFGILCGLVKLDYDVDRIASSPEAFQFVLKVLGEFVRPEMKNAELGAEENNPESGVAPAIVGLGSMLRTDHKKTILPSMPTPDTTSFREIIKKIASTIPSSCTHNNPTNVNILLHDLNSTLLKVRGVQYVDVDLIVCKLLTYWCKCYGGYAWFKVDSIYQPRVRSRNGKRDKSRELSSKPGDEIAEEPKVLVIEKPPVTVTKMQMDTFLNSNAYILMLDWVREFRAKIEHRKNMESIGLDVEPQAASRRPSIAFVDIFAEEENSEFDEFKPKKITLPTLVYPTSGLTHAFVNFKDRDGVEVSFEEFRMSSDTINRKISLSLILRTKMNQVHTVRAAPFDTAGTVLERCKLCIMNPHRQYVLAYDGERLDENTRLIKYRIKNNACLRLYEEEEWEEACFVQDQARGGDKNYQTGGWNDEYFDGPPLSIQTSSYY